MKKETWFLKLAVILIGFPVLVLAIALYPIVIREAAQGSSAMAGVLYAILTVIYLTVIPFYLALVQALKLLSLIDAGQAFSELSVQAIRRIKRYAGMIAGLYVLGLPLFYIAGEVDDAPGVILIGLFLVVAPAVVAVFAAVLNKLLSQAIELKTDQDLTI